MTGRLDHELSQFMGFVRSGKLGRYQTESLDEYGVVLRHPDRVQGNKSLDLTLMGLTHGNELAGIAVLNRVLGLMGSRTVDVPLNVAFILGNPWAAKEDRRFLESDLNRSFMRRDPPATKEQHRARDLEKILQETAYLVDFHQTMQSSDRPFFIFPYRREAFRFARDIRPPQTIVTHWGDSFSKDGFCTDEYVNSCGGTGITIELGQNGFDSYQIDSGVVAALQSLRVVAGYQGALEPLLDGPDVGLEGPIFTWAEIMAWPQMGNGLVTLEPGLTNFKEVYRGQRLGDFAGQEIMAPADGRVIFAKYLSHKEQKSLLERPKELLRLMREIKEAELPEDH